MTYADHPHTDPGDGRTECDVCGKWIWEVTHSCKGVAVTDAARSRLTSRLGYVTIAPRIKDRQPRG